MRGTRATAGRGRGAPALEVPRASRSRSIVSALRRSLVTLGVVVIVVTLAVVWTARIDALATTTVVDESTRLARSAELARALNDYHRLSNAWLSTRQPALVDLRSDAELEVRRLLDELSASSLAAGSAQAELAEHIDAYLAERARLEQQGFDLAAVVAGSRPELERALDDVAGIHDRTSARLDRLQRSAQRASDVEMVLVVMASAVRLLGLGMVYVGARRLVVQPIVDLHAAVQRFRDGDGDARAPAAQLGELDALSTAFNDMVAELSEQRKAQLTFLAAVAHDLRNPLHTLRLGLRTLDDAALPPDRRHRLEQQVDRLSRMVGDLLDASRIEAGQLELVLDDVDLGAAAQRAAETFEGASPVHDVTARVDAPPVTVRGDALRLDQVMSNLLSNAIKYSPAGGPVEIAVRAVDGEAELAVSDRGVGIPPEDVPGLFAPFKRRPVPGQPIQGVGLGLSIVRRIVVAHGGRVDVEARAGGGTTFRVRLPRALAREGASARAPGRLPVPGGRVAPA